MWKLSEIYAQNLCSFRELNYKPEQGLTTLIFGNNLDNESQKSNGSGKSALIETVAIGITGTPLRKIKTEEIINDNSDECFIELAFTNDNSRETLLINRRLFRKGSSEIACSIVTDGKVQPVHQHSVDGYNKYILERLGITKEELFNNFILSKYRYQDFLSCSDKEKKEIINRFSNGNMVDRAIDKILEDKNPLLDLQKRTDLEFAGYEGRIDMLKEQIEKEENSKEERAKTKQEKITELERMIAEKRGLIRDSGEELNLLDVQLIEIDGVDKLLQDLENSDRTMEEYLESIGNYVAIVNKTPMSDWGTIIETKKKKIREAEDKLKQWDNAFAEYEEKVIEATGKYDEVSAGYQKFQEEFRETSSKYENDIKQLDDEYREINKKLEEIKRVRRSLSEVIETLKNKLAGVITCPQCGFEFLIAEKGFDVQRGKDEVNLKEAEYITLASRMNDFAANMETIEKGKTDIRNKKRKLLTREEELSDRVKAAQRDVQISNHELDGARREQTQFINLINQLQNEIDGILRQVFDEAFSMIDDAYKLNERKKKNIEDDIKSVEGSIAGLESTIQELNSNTTSDILHSLKESLKEFQKKSSKVLIKKSKIEEELKTLDRQEQNFVEFKTYLANTKIEALSKITNEFLESIGSDIRIKFSGYTVLKSGKVREKISVTLVRAGIDSGSFGKFSAGEAARVNLATILAMQKLINSNCESDKGLDLLILDEILEAVDEDGLASMFAALNTLSITALVVSHGNIAESYPHKVQITKENGESRIETGSNS